MKSKLLEVLRCAKCLGKLVIRDPQYDVVQEIHSATLLCVGCQEPFPVVRGIPRMLVGLEPKQIRESFSEEWLMRYSGKFENAGVLYGQDVKLLVSWMVKECIGAGKPGDWLLDAGCGSGEKAIQLARQNPEVEVVAIDLVDSIERLRDMASDLDNLHFVQGDLLNPPFESDTFPRIVSWSVLHHTPDTERAFRSVSRLVSPQGRFVVWIYPHPDEDAFMKWYCRIRDVHFLGNGPKLSPWLRLFLSRIYVIMMAPVLLYIDYFIVRPKYQGVPYMISEKRSLLEEFESGVFLVYDALTPAYHHFHQREEVMSWFCANGFTSPRSDNLGHYWGQKV